MNIRKIFFLLHDEPNSFKRIEVRRIGRQMEGFEEVPVEALPFLTGRIVKDRDVPFFSRNNDPAASSRKT